MVRRRTETYRDDWRTPPELFEWCSQRWGPFDVDLCASDDHHLLPDYYTAQNSAMDHVNEWKYKNVFVNPPYGDLMPWVSSFSWGAASVTAILPANTSSAWFEHVWDAAEIIFLLGRVSFLDHNNRPHPGNNSGTVIVRWSSLADLQNISHRNWITDIRDPIRAQKAAIANSATTVLPASCVSST